MRTALVVAVIVLSAHLGVAQTPTMFGLQTPVAKHVQAHGTVDLDAFTACDHAGQVGVLVSSDDPTATSLEIRGGTIQGCEIGLLVKSTAEQPVTVSGVSILDQPVSDLMQRQGLAKTAATVAERAGLWLTGVGGTATNNTVNGYTYGIMLTGWSWTIQGNTLNGNTHGIMISGHRNLIESNTMQANSRNGIFVGQAAPSLSDSGARLKFAERSAENVIRFNTSLGNGLYDLFELHPICPGGPLPASNQWTSNAFNTRNNPCLS